jgi:hypothetical protein
MQPSAQTAIRILESIKTACTPSLLAYWSTPNVILTLSGASAFCDGIFWSDERSKLEAWKAEIDKVLPAIHNATPLIDRRTAIETVRDNETYTSFELITRQGLEYCLQRTTLLKEVNTKPLLQTQDMAMLQELLIGMLEGHPELQTFSKEGLNHAAFGLLLGYPDEAIVGLLRAEQQEKDPFAEPFVDADIRGAGYYDCPKPIYSYPRHLINNKVIQRHEQLWSHILEEYYHSDFHKTLEKDKQFQEKITELGALS